MYIRVYDALYFQLREIAALQKRFFCHIWKMKLRHSLETSSSDAKETLYLAVLERVKNRTGN